MSETMADSTTADAELKSMANAIRALAMDAVEAANSGHPGMPMGMADVATVLWSEFLKFDAADPHWADRDRYVLSAGHGSMLLYALLHLTGFQRPTIDDIKQFRQLGSPCAGHPERHELAGVETTTGPLGQGLATAVGMAMAERHLNSLFGGGLVDHRTWVVAGDGCLMEGVSHEAIGLAGHLKLARLTVLWDDNGISIDGPIARSSSEDVPARFRAVGWHVVSCDGHDFNAIRTALAKAVESDRPTLVQCRTVIGYGAPTKAGSEKTHGSPLGAAEVAGARERLGWTSPPFDIPADIAARWHASGTRHADTHAAWQARLEASTHAAEFRRRATGRLPADFSLSAFKEALVTDLKPLATRKSSEMALEAINKALPETIGGSADLTGSNNTKTSGHEAMTSVDYSGRYVYYGIREFGMAAAMNGMSLHGGIIPYGGTFLVFADYCRAAIRLSALQEQGVIYVMTHDSIGLGEDGPTHQPIEHLASLRAMPNVAVYRPCDAVETAECWELALADRKRPSVLALSRQNLPPMRCDVERNRSDAGAYRLIAATAARRVVIVATGSEVHLAAEVGKTLELQGIGTDVVSMPCWERFSALPVSDQRELFPADALKVSVEAAATYGWDRVVGQDGLMIGIDTFGASAPAEDLFRHFGLTADQITSKITKRLQEQEKTI